MLDDETIARRMLVSGQECAVYIFDTATEQLAEVFRTRQLALEAPNWWGEDKLILNGDGVLWQLHVGTGQLARIAHDDLPFLNNDHVLAPGNDRIYASACDWHVHDISLTDGSHRRATGVAPLRPIRHFLHGVSPDGGELAFVGIEPRRTDPWGPANIFTMTIADRRYRQWTFGDSAADGCEYSPGGQWIYFNTEMYSDAAGHAQIARISRTDGHIEQLTFDDRVNWFPHLAPQGGLACYLSYAPGTLGHPANVPVDVVVVRNENWERPLATLSLFGGQGTMNVNSWSPDGKSFALVAYPIAPQVEADSS